MGRRGGLRGGIWVVDLELEYQFGRGCELEEFIVCGRCSFRRAVEEVFTNSTSASRSGKAQTPFARSNYNGYPCKKLIGRVYPLIKSVSTSRTTPFLRLTFPTANPNSAS